MAAAFALAAPSAAWADIPHTVAPGESLWSVARTDGLSVAQLAAENGVSSTSRLLAGRVLMIPPQARAGANRANHGAVTGVDRGVVAGGNGATNVTAFIQTNIGSIQANVGSRSQSNTATGNTLSATGGDDDMATGGSATASGAGSLAVGGNADARGDDALAATGHASIGSGDSSNRAGGYTAKANRDTAAAASGGTGGDDLQTRALLSLWSRLGELVMPVTLARGWLPLLQQRSATRPRSPAPAR